MMSQPQDDDDDDCWNAFGSEEEEEDDDVDESTHITPLCEQGVLWLTQHFVRWNPQIHLVQRRVYTQRRMESRPRGTWHASDPL